MPARLCIALTLVAALAAGCSVGGDEEAACDAPRMAGDPALPDGFPTPSGVTYTSTREEGPGTIVEGRRDGDAGAAADAYRRALAVAGYRVTGAEDAVGFAGGGTDGQVRLRGCDGGTSIEITVRAA